MAEIVTEFVANGNLTYRAAAAADTVKVGSILHVRNGSGSSINVTVDNPNPCNFGVTNSVHDFIQAVPAGEQRFIPITAKFDKGNGEADVAYSSTTTVTVAAFR